MRKALRPIDETIGTFDHIAEHPEMGLVNYAHLTLTDLSAFFPDAYDRINDYRSVAIVRDPADRFFSAIFQRLREFKGFNQSEITAKVIDHETEMVIAHLQSAIGRLTLEYVHFNRQSDYIFKDGVRIVDRVFALDRLADAATYIETCTGVRLAPDAPENRTVALRAGPLTPLASVLRKPYSAMVPLQLRERVRAGLTNIGVYASVEKRQFVKSGSAIERFLHDYYRQDFDLFATANAH